MSMLTQLTLLVPQAKIEQVGDALEALDALSVSVQDADADTPHEQAIYGEPGLPAPLAGWEHSIVTALFAQVPEARHAAEVLQAQDFFHDCHVKEIQSVPEQDWVSLTQSQFEPVAITQDFWIVPSWHERPPQARFAMQLDPGLAFGTGTHPTTRMCLQWLRAHTLQGYRVLDYGCGSGILAIAAGLLGAEAIDAVDIDPAAVDSTLRNAQINGTTLQAGLPEMANGHYQVVLANILASPLTVLAPLLCQHVEPQGHLVLAGILSRQTTDIQAAYAPWMRLSVADEQEGWALMVGQRSS